MNNYIVLFVTIIVVLITIVGIFFLESLDKDNEVDNLIKKALGNESETRN